MAGASDLDLGPLAASAAWAHSCSDVAAVPPARALRAALAAGHDADDPALTELVAATTRAVALIFQQLPDAHRSRDELVADWRTL